MTGFNARVYNKVKKSIKLINCIAKQELVFVFGGYIKQFKSSEKKNWTLIEVTNTDILPFSLMRTVTQETKSKNINQEQDRKRRDKPTHIWSPYL